VHASSSLYASFSHKLKRAAVLKVALGIGGDEIAHFLAWVDFAGSAIQGSPFNFLDAQSSVANQDIAFPSPNRKPSGPLCQICLSFPVPGDVMDKAVACRPVIGQLDDQFSGAVATINSFTRNGLFVGQSTEFMHTLMQIAEDADCAIRK